MLTHLRKAEAEDIFDNLHSSVAYQGAQDTLWVLERPPHDAAGVLHIREKDSDDQTLHVFFVDGHWEFLGCDTEVKLSRGRQAILELFEEKERALSIDEILKGLSRPRSRYQTVRKTLQRMVQDEQLVRLDRGRYATARGSPFKARSPSRDRRHWRPWGHLGTPPSVSPSWTLIDKALIPLGTWDSRSRTSQQTPKMSRMSPASQASFRVPAFDVPASN